MSLKTHYVLKIPKANDASIVMIHVKVFVVRREVYESLRFKHQRLAWYLLFHVLLLLFRSAVQRV